jgi:exosortase/archaeosortase family protein
VWSFILRFLAYWVLGLAAVSLITPIDKLAIQGTLASLKLLLLFTGAEVNFRTGIVHLGSVTMRIVSECTPLTPTILVWAAVLACPTSWRNRLIGLGVSAAVLWGYNLLRVLVLVPVLTWWPHWFDFIHVYLWQTITLIVALGTFLLWLRIQVRHVAS